MIESSHQIIPSSIRDNRARGSVGDFLLRHLKSDSSLTVVSAYFTIYAYHRLKAKLDAIQKMDFLFGEPRFLKALDPNKTDRKEFQIEDDKLVIPLASRLQQRTIARECAAWIREKASIKSMVKPNFLHGKMYFLRDQNGIEKAVAGSSNFTVNGLGFGKSPNIELNIEIDSDRDRVDLHNWFIEIWNDKSGLVEDVKDEVLKYLEQLYLENAPEFIYYKTLFHLFENYLTEQKSGSLLDERTGFLDSHVWRMLYDFQKDGVRGAINKILKHNGCIIADSVGLGKTFEALAVIKYFELKNDRVLVLCPKKLRENWTTFKQNSELNPLIADRFRYDVLSHTDLSRQGGQSGDIDLSNVSWGNYDLVVIDESHNFRNSERGRTNDDGSFNKNRYAKLMEDIIRSGVRTKVLLLSATPVNTNLKDLRNQLYLITAGKDDALFESAQISHLGQTIKNAQQQFTLWADPKKNPERSVKGLLERLDSSFFKLLDELTIARSRKHIKAYYTTAELSSFPRRLPVISIAPKIDTRNEFPTYDDLNREISNYRLSLFNPLAYVKEEKLAEYEQQVASRVKAFTQKRREHYLIGMMKVNFLKRLESSIEAFEISIRRTLDKVSIIEQKIHDYQNSGRLDEIFEGSAFMPDEIEFTESEENSELEETWDEVGQKKKYKLADMKVEEWLQDLQKDKQALIALHEAACAVTPDRDQKLAKLKQMIAQKADNPVNPPNKKVLIFTAFADTAFYLYEALENWARNQLGLHLAVVTGGTRGNRSTLQPHGFRAQTDFNAILTNFSPLSKQRAKMKHMPQSEEIDILIATDCISEGQNLQDCDYLINYDIHWNPVRIIQRFGRIDRLGSCNRQIQLVNFWPTDDLNKYLNLKDRVEARMALVDIAATGEDNLLDPEQIKDLVTEELKFRDRQLVRLQKEVIDLEDLDENISLTDFTLDGFRVDLLNYLEKNREQLRDAPLGLYAIVPAEAAKSDLHTKDSQTNPISSSASPTSLMQSGVIFCLRQKGDTAGNEQVNPLQPYFLVYIYDDGHVRLNYTHAKQILEVFRSLCQGITQPYEQLCDQFDQETDHGRNMKAYDQLLQRAVKEIARVFRHRSARELQKGRDALLIPDNKQAAIADDFELITWLVIK